MPWCLEPFAEGRRRASTMGSCVACQQQAAAILHRYDAFIFSLFYFYFSSLFFLRGGEVWFDGRSRTCMGEVGSVVAEAHVLNSWERRRIEFHDRVAQSWGDLQVVWRRLLQVSVSLSCAIERDPTALQKTKNRNKKQTNKKNCTGFIFACTAMHLEAFIFQMWLKKRQEPTEGEVIPLVFSAGDFFKQNQSNEAGALHDKRCFNAGKCVLISREAGETSTYFILLYKIKYDTRYGLNDLLGWTFFAVCGWLISLLPHRCHESQFCCSTDSAAAFIPYKWIYFEIWMSNYQMKAA